MTDDTSYNRRMPDLFRHIAACNNTELPGGRLALRLGAEQVGWVTPETAAALQRHGAAATPDGVTIAPGRLPDAARALSAEGRFRWRHEDFDVRATPDGPALAQLDRGALPAFGVQAVGVHLNGLVRRGDALWMWLARRAADKLLDPGKLDHLVAGGVPAGLTPRAALEKEADEEAALPAALIQGAQQVATLSYAMQRPEGLRRDRLHCYDLLLPEAFVPHPQDGEVEVFELHPLPDVLDRLRRTEDFKFNVTLVLIDLFLRTGLIVGPEAVRLRRGLDGG